MNSAPTPLISVLMPAYNAEGFIAQAITSIQAQDVLDWELIIVDDGSTDGTTQIVQQFVVNDPRIRTFSQTNAGPSMARSKALSLACAPITYFLDSDDRIRPGALRRFVDTFQQHPECVAVYGYKVRIAPQGELIDDPNVIPPYSHLRSGNLLRGLMLQNHIAVGTIACRADALRTSYVPTHLEYGEDWVVWARLALHGKFIALKAPAVMEHRSHLGGSQTYRTLDVLPKRLATVDALYSDTDLTAGFGWLTLRIMKRISTANIHKFIGVRHLARRDYRSARKWMVKSIFFWPFSVSTWVLAILSVIGFIPDFVAKRIGATAQT